MRCADTEEHRHRQLTIAWNLPKVAQEHFLLAMGCADLHTYRRFLRARKHNAARAKAMWQDHLGWRAENGVDAVMEDFNFQEREAFMSLYPRGPHKTDKLVRVARMPKP
jgi:hypothetical protein